MSKIRFTFEVADSRAGEVGLCGAGCGHNLDALGIGDKVPVSAGLLDYTITKITKRTYDDDNVLLSTEVTE